MAEKVRASKAATEINYTAGQLAAIEVLKANRGQKLSAKDLGISAVVLTGLITKANDERPMAEGVERAIVHSEKVEYVCPTCGNKSTHNLYWMD